MVSADLSLCSEAEELLAEHTAEANEPRAVFVEAVETSWPQLENMYDVAMKEFRDVDDVVPRAGVYKPQWSRNF